MYPRLLSLIRDYIPAILCKFIWRDILPYEALLERSMAGAEGIEPPMPGPKPGALPLGDAPILTHTLVYVNLRHDPR